MSSFNFPKSITSRPVYGRLEVVPGSHHLFIADDEGGEAVCDLLEKNKDIIPLSQFIFINKAKNEALVKRINNLNVNKLSIGPSFQSESARIYKVLSTAKMGVRVYLAGTEGLIGQAMRDAASVGIDPAAIITEHRGSTARRVQCVHCKGITEDVSVTPFQCSHCGLHLFVRDHYSRRIAAFQGVRVDAEDPGNIPAQEDIYS